MKNPACGQGQLYSFYFLNSVVLQHPCKMTAAASRVGLPRSGRACPLWPACLRGQVCWLMGLGPPAATGVFPGIQPMGNVDRLWREGWTAPFTGYGDLQTGRTVEALQWWRRIPECSRRPTMEGRWYKASALETVVHCVGISRCPSPHLHTADFNQLCNWEWKQHLFSSSNTSNISGCG